MLLNLKMIGLILIKFYCNKNYNYLFLGVFLERL